MFKTKGFARAARRVRITDVALCVAIGEVMRGQADSLGGGVWKKRLGQNRERAIILAKGDRRWVYEFLFSKQNREGISDAELAGFRQLAAVYATLQETAIAAMLTNGDWTEICHDSEIKVQK